MVRLNDTELERLDENCPAGIARAVYLRGLLREPPDRKDIADRREVLALLSGQARPGKVAAAIALLRALKDEDGPRSTTRSSASSGMSDRRVPAASYGQPCSTRSIRGRTGSA
jgi:hypothetical protein